MFKQKASKFIKENQLFIFFIIADLVLMTLHLSFYKQYSFFHFDVESNLPTAYQGLKLLTYGFICLQAFVFINRDENKRKKLFWLLPALFFIYIGVDELAMIHENIHIFIEEISPTISNSAQNFSAKIGYTGTIWIVYYLPIAIIAIPFLVFELIEMYSKNRKELFIFIFGVLILFLVPLMEIFSTSGCLLCERYDLLMFLEESFEKIGITVIGFAFLLILKKQKLIQK